MEHALPRNSPSAKPLAPAAVGTLLGMFLLVPAAAFAAEPAAEIEQILSDLPSQGANFKPDKLRKTGLRGFRALLDRFLPETARLKKSTLSRAEAQRLIRRMGDDSYKVREAATRRLIAEARGFADLISQAARDKDLEVSLRAKSILAAWESGTWDAERLAVAEYGTGFLIYLEGMTDEACWVELARRVCKAFERSSPRGRKRMILAHCLEQIAKSGKDTYCKPLIPLLLHRETSVAVWVTRLFGSHRGNRYFPVLLIEALKSDRELVVDTAISWAPNCWDRSRAKQVRELLTRIFDGDNEKLKFHACFPLMHGYQDRRAIAYLLAQAASPDKERAVRAIGWLGDACNSGRAAYPALLAKLGPLLASEDSALRRPAVEALATYAGEEVVRRLIPFLADKESIIASEAARGLLDQRDKAMLKRHLLAAEKSSPSQTVRQKAKELLARLATKAKP